jgi:hypothetical protein
MKDKKEIFNNILLLKNNDFILEMNKIEEKYIIEILEKNEELKLLYKKK